MLLAAFSNAQWKKTRVADKECAGGAEGAGDEIVPGSSDADCVSETESVDAVCIQSESESSDNGDTAVQLRDSVCDVSPVLVAVDDDEVSQPAATATTPASAAPVFHSVEAASRSSTDIGEYFESATGTWKRDFDPWSFSSKEKLHLIDCHFTPTRQFSFPVRNQYGKKEHFGSSGW